MAVAVSRGAFIGPTKTVSTSTPQSEYDRREDAQAQPSAEGAVSQGSYIGPIATPTGSSG